MDGLTPEEIKFFETGDASVLQPAPAPAEPTPVEAPPPAPEPAPAPAPAPATEGSQADFQRLLLEEQRRFMELEQRLAQIQERLAPPAPAPPPVPDIDTNPFGHLMHKIDSIAEELQTLRNGAVKQEQVSEQQQQFNALKSAIQTAKSEFVKTAPDFDSAYQHLRAQRAEDLRDSGVPEAKIAEALLMDELQVSQVALQQRKNPAEVIYKMAKRYGYQGKPPAPAAAAPTPEERIAQLQAGQQAAIAPSKGAADGTITLASLKEADDATLSKVASDPKLWNEIMGGGKKDIFYR